MLWYNEFARKKGDKMRNEIIKDIGRNKIIAIVRGVEKKKLIPLAEAMYDGEVANLI